MMKPQMAKIKVLAMKERVSQKLLKDMNNKIIKYQLFEEFIIANFKRQFCLVISAEKKVVGIIALKKYKNLYLIFLDKILS